MSQQLVTAEIPGNLYLAYQIAGMEKPRNRKPLSSKHSHSAFHSADTHRKHLRIRRHIPEPMSYQVKKLGIHQSKY